MDQEIKAPWRANVLTLFEEMFPGPLEHSLAGQGIKDGRWILETLDPWTAGLLITKNG